MIKKILRGLILIDAYEEPRHRLKMMFDILHYITGYQAYYNIDVVEVSIKNPKRNYIYINSSTKSFCKYGIWFLGPHHASKIFTFDEGLEIIIMKILNEK